MRPLHYRAATGSDISALVALVTSAYRGDASKQGWTTEADMLDGQRVDAQGLLQDITQPDSMILLAECDGALLACAHIAIKDGAGYFGMFAVSPVLQGAGIGKQVIARAEQIVHEQWGQASIRMTVIDIRHSLIAFYERRGYRRTGVYAPFPYGDIRYGIPKRDDLRFEVLEKTFATGAPT